MHLKKQTKILKVTMKKSCVSIFGTPCIPVILSLYNTFQDLPWLYFLSFYQSLDFVRNAILFLQSFVMFLNESFPNLQTCVLCSVFWQKLCFRLLERSNDRWPLSFCYIGPFEDELRLCVFCDAHICTFKFRWFWILLKVFAEFFVCEYCLR